MIRLLGVVRPETVVGWHRQGFRRYWAWKSRRRSGRPIIDTELRDLIRRMSRANPLWGALRIHGELLKLGLTVSQATVSKYAGRGGASIRRDYKLLEDEAVLQARADRHDFRPYGLYGGGPGRPSNNVLNPDGDKRELPGKFTMNMKRGDVLRSDSAGPGGWGDPLERDPARVARDVRNEFVSRAAARGDYGVVLKGEGFEVDEAATTTLRAELRAKRGWKEPPVVSR
jgi:N-methylhydantoinase B